MADTEDFSKLCGERSMWTWFTCDLSVREELEHWLGEALSEMAEKKRLALTIIDKKSKAIAGSTSIGNISVRDKRAEIGWTWIARDFQGKGLNQAVKHALLKYCFEENDFERIEFKTDVLNIHARRALSAMGMVEEGVLRSHTLMTKDRRRDTIYYSVLRGEWKDIKQRNNWF